MASQGKYVRFAQLDLAEVGNGFRGADLVESENMELSFLTGDAGAGHGFHSHDDVDEVLIFLEGSCDFNLGGEEIHVSGGSMIYAPAGVEHKVRYKAASKVLRIKFPKGR
jgi:quercetin dioxygenase-like cupin family protein